MVNCLSIAKIRVEIMLKHIPNIITLINAFCGCLVIVSLFTNQISMVPWLIAIALLADFSDGLAARLLKASSPIGKELDSMSDMVSFGVVPGVILYYLMNKALGIGEMSWEMPNTWLGFSGFLVTVFSALRLAKFNVDTRQTDNFVGLNTPATTLFCTGLLLVVENNAYGLADTILQFPLLLGLAILLSILLVAEIPIFSLKFKNLGWKENAHRWLFITICLVLLLCLKIGLAAILIIFIYISISLVLWMLGRLKI